MIDISAKNTTLRTAVAEATVSTSSPDTVEAILNKQVPKGDVFEMAKAAGLLDIQNNVSFSPFERFVFVDFLDYC